MYKKGDLRISTPPYDEGKCKEAEDGVCYNEEHKHIDDDVIAFLPHSCDEWEIGGPEQIREMIEDLQDALERIEASKDQVKL